MSNDNTTYWLLFRGLRHHLGLWLKQEYRRAKGEFKSNPANKCWRCGICGKNINKKKEQTIDHIIPANLLWEYELPLLLIDPRNFRAAHKLCNVQRGELTIDDMPPKVKSKLFDSLRNKNAHN